LARTRHDSDDDEEVPDWEGDEDDYDDDSLATVPCPYCRAEIIEDAEQCPKCGQYLSREDAPSTGKSGYWWVLVLLALAVALMWAAGRG
jgi:zinc-ribbon domain